MFGVLNILGSRNIHRDRVKFDQRKDCSEGICTKEVALNYPGAANIYLQYSFFETSYFIFAKGQNYADIFKKKAYLSDNAGCYPIETFGDEDRLREFLNLPRLDPKEVDFAARRVPCGLKAALFRFIGKLNVYELTSDNDEPSEIALNRQDLVDKAYLDAAKVYSLTEDPLPTNGEFLSWYLPQVPGRGTKVLVAKADNGLQGNIRFVFDKSKSEANVQHRSSMTQQNVPPSKFKAKAREYQSFSTT